MVFRGSELQPDRSMRDLYGSEMRRLRERDGLSLASLAAVLTFSKGHLSRIERAESLPPPGLSEKLDAAFGTDFFWRVYPIVKDESVPDRYRRFMELAATATLHESYTGTVHGLLQTRAFATAVLRSGDPTATPTEIADRVKVRLQRQDRLRATDVARYWFIMDEASLRRCIGGADAMVEQLESLLTAIELPHVTIQILPFAAGEHSELTGSLTLLTLPDRSTVAYEEGPRSGHLIEDPETITHRRGLYDLLRAQALSPRDSAAMIRAAIKEYGDG